MNEQLIVKNFGPIKDATVDFKRVTVFIGPTGGGKSTLAKLAAAFSNSLFLSYSPKKRKEHFTDYAIDNFFQKSSYFEWINPQQTIVADEKLDFTVDFDKTRNIGNLSDNIVAQELSNAEDRKTFFNLITYTSEQASKESSEITSELLQNFSPEALNLTARFLKKLFSALDTNSAKYFPSERIFISAASYSWPGFIRDDIGLPKQLVNFANNFSVSKKEVSELQIEFLGIKYIHRDGQDYIQVPGVETLLRLYEAASGIQSVTPLLVLLEHLSRNTEQAQSFIIEEPELNLYPTAQQGLLNWLVEKCTKGENDLTITTHSPYLLAHFNTLLFAHQVAQNHPERADEIARIVPRESWIDPKEFAAYHVEGQKENGVRSIVNPETGLISYNGLDAIASAEATEFEKLLDINAGLEVAW